MGWGFALVQGVGVGKEWQKNECKGLAFKLGSDSAERRV